MAKQAKNGRRGSGRRATSYDVAHLAGVSQSAVSRVFKPGASASKQMRERVLSAARKLGYRPNAIARGLITQRSNLAGVVISKMTNLYYPEVLVELTQRFSERGVRVLLFALERESEIDSILDQILEYQVDGVITAARLSSKQIALFKDAGTPIIFYNRTIADASVNSVHCDQEEGERWLVSQLVDAGHRSFSIISGPEDSVVSMERTRGALTKLKELGVQDVTVVGGDYSYESGRSGLRMIVERQGRAPDAVICANDVMAIGCIDAARDQFGLDVPGDLSVVGFDGVGPAAWSSYRLTTVRQPVRRMTEAAVSMLLEHIENPDLPPEKREFSGIKVRGGSAKLNA